MGNDTLDTAVALMDAVEQSAASAASAAKRAVRERSTETLDAAHERVSALKLTPAERQIVDDVFASLERGDVSRLKSKRISKKEVFEIYDGMQLTERERKKRYVLDMRPSNYWVIQDEATLRKLDDMLGDEIEIGADTETTGLDIYNDTIIGWSFYLPRHDVAAYVPFGHTTGQQQVSEDFAMSVARKHVETRALSSIWQNYRYDGHMFLNSGVEVRNPTWDTKIVGALLNEHESHRLKDMHAKYVLGKPDDAIQFEELFEGATIFDKDVILAGIYAAGDPHKTHQVYQFQKPHIDTRDNLKTVWYQIEQPLLSVDLRLERTGFRLDLDRIQALLERFTPQLEQAEIEMRAAFGLDDSAFVGQMNSVLETNTETFNLASPAHMAYLLYDVLGCDPTIGRKFRLSDRSTGAKVLDVLVEQHETLAPMRRYRTLHKIVHTYLA